MENERLQQRVIELRAHSAPQTPIAATGPSSVYTTTSMPPARMIPPAPSAIPSQTPTIYSPPDHVAYGDIMTASVQGNFDGTNPYRGSLYQSSSSSLPPGFEDEPPDDASKKKKVSRGIYSESSDEVPYPWGCLLIAQKDAVLRTICLRHMWSNRLPRMAEGSSPRFDILWCCISSISLTGSLYLFYFPGSTWSKNFMQCLRSPVGKGSGKGTWINVPTSSVITVTLDIWLLAAISHLHR